MSSCHPEGHPLPPTDRHRVQNPPSTFANDLQYLTNPLNPTFMKCFPANVTNSCRRQGHVCPLSVGPPPLAVDYCYRAILHLAAVHRHQLLLVPLAPITLWALPFRYFLQMPRRHSFLSWLDTMALVAALHHLDSLFARLVHLWNFFINVWWIRRAPPCFFPEPFPS